MTFGRPGTGDREVKVDLENTGLLLEQREFYFGFIRELKEVLASELRTYFEGNPRTADYRWIGKPTQSGGVETDVGRSKLIIASTRPDKPQKMVSVLVGSVSGRPRDLWFNAPTLRFSVANPAYSEADKATTEATGAEYLIPERLVVGERLTGRCDWTVSVEIRALTDAELDGVSDLVLHGLVGQVRLALDRQGLNWIPDRANVSGVSEEKITELQSQLVRTISFELRSDWYDDYFYQAVTIEDIEIEQITRQGPQTL